MPCFSSGLLMHDCIKGCMTIHGGNVKQMFAVLLNQPVSYNFSEALAYLSDREMLTNTSSDPQTSFFLFDVGFIGWKY